jgi:hypothetical protein
MAFSKWLRFSTALRQDKSTRRGGSRRPERPKAIRPLLEALEDRWLPSAVSWISTSSGDWDTPGNWSTGALPTPADDVTINKPGVTVTHSLGNFDAVHSLTSTDAIVLPTGTLVLGAASSISGTFTLSGGTLSGVGTLTVSGQLAWSGGTMSGSGVTIANGGLAITGTSSELLDRRTLTNAATGTWDGSNDLNLTNGAVFNNASGATFTVNNDRTIGDFGAATNTFNNVGTFTKAGGGGVTIVNTAFKDPGTVNVNSGTLRLQNRGNASGTFTVAALATLDFNLFSSYLLTAASTISGAGSVTFDAGSTTVAGTYNVTGNTTVNGGTANFRGTLTSVGAVLAVNGGTANFASDYSIATINLNGGVLGGPSNATVTGAFTWTGGTLAGTGSTTVAATATLSISSTSTVGLATRTLNNAGTGTWGSTGGISFSNGATFNNQTGASFTASNDANISLSGFGTINNAGTFAKSPNLNTTALAVPFYNTGTLNVSSGTLSLQGGGSSTGPINVAASSTLDFGGGLYKIAAGATLSGAGSVILDAGNLSVPGTYNITGGTTVNGGNLALVGTLTAVGPIVTITGGTANFARDVSTGTLLLSGGALIGSGTVSVTGLLNWTGGTMGGVGSTTVAAGATLSINTSSGLTLDARTLTNSGAAGTWGGTGNWTFTNGATFTNSAGATFTVNNDQTITNNGYATNTINNAGTFTKSPSTNTTTINAFFNNTGTLKVNSGTLVLAGGGVNTKTITVAAGKTLTFAGGNFRHTPASSITGGGSVIFSGGYSAVNGTYNISGASSSTTVTGGTAEFTGTLTSVGPTLTITAGTAFFFRNFSTGTLNLTGGTLGGSGDITVNSLLNWTGGGMGGTGSTTVAAAATLSLGGSSQLSLDGWTLKNAGTGTWSGTGNIAFADAAAFINQAGAHFTVTNDQNISFSGFGTITNAGTFTKSPNLNTTALGLLFYNTGTVNVSSGTLSFQGGGSSTGTFTVVAGSTLDFGGSSTSFGLAAGSTVSGAGKVTFSNGTVTVAGTYNITGGTTIQGGFASFVKAPTSVGPTLAISSGTAEFSQGFSVATLALTGGTLTGAGDITVTAQMTWTGGASLTGDGSTTVAAGATLAINGSSNLGMDTRTLTNAGTGTWSGTANLFLGNGATFNNASGATFTVNNDQSVNAFGTSAVINNAGTFTKSPSSNTTTINIRFNNTGTVNVNSGTLVLGGGGSATGSFIVASGKTLNFAGFAYLLDVGSSVTGAGSVIFSGGVNDIAGTYNTTGATSVTGGAVNFYANANTGTFTTASTVSIGPGTTFSIASGDYTQTAGTTTLNGGTITVAAGNKVNIQAGTLNAFGTINGNLSNAGSLFVAGNGITGLLTVNGNYTQTAAAALSFDLEGTTAGVQYDKLAITGSATLAGTLNVAAIDGFTPAVGAVFTIMTYGSRSGNFSTFNLFGNGRTLTANPLTTSYTITAS